MSLLVRPPSTQDQKSFGRRLLRSPAASRKMDNSRKTEPGQAERNKWISLLVLLVVPFLGVIDFFISIIGIPSIKNSLHAGFIDAEIIVCVYSFTFAV